MENSYINNILLKYENLSRYELCKVIANLEMIILGLKSKLKHQSDKNSDSNILELIGCIPAVTVIEALGQKSPSNSSIDLLLGDTSLSLYDNLVGDGNLLSLIDGTNIDDNSSNLRTKINEQISLINNGSSSIHDGLMDVSNMLGGNPILEKIGDIEDNDKNIKFLIDGIESGDIYNSLKNVRSSIDGSNGSYLASPGDNFNFDHYTGTTSDHFSTNSINVVNNVITIKIGSDNYSYEVTKNIFQNADIIVFKCDEKEFSITYSSDPIENVTNSQNAADLASALRYYLNTDTSITPGNIQSKVLKIINLSDPSSSDLETSMNNIMNRIYATADFDTLNTQNSSLTCVSYSGTHVKKFTGNNFVNQGSSITIQIGNDTYTYNGFGKISLLDEESIRFTFSDKCLIFKNTSENDINSSTDTPGSEGTNLCTILAGYLNTYFSQGSMLVPRNVYAKLGVPLINDVQVDSISELIGIQKPLADAIGDPVRGGGIFDLIRAPYANDNTNVWKNTVIDNFNSQTSLKGQLDYFLYLFNMGETWKNSGDTIITFDFTISGNPTCLADIISAVSATSS